MIKVWFHCLIRMFSKKCHAMCSERINNGKPRHFCSCGYNNNGLTWNEYKLQVDEKWRKLNE